MEKGIAHRDETTGRHSNKITLLLSAGAAIALLSIGISLHLFLPKESKACALMPGFCKDKEDAAKSPKAKLHQGYHTDPKFGLNIRGY